MAGYGGYFLKGLAGGLQTGFNMGQMKWQQNEKKKLQKKQDEMMEASSVFNNMVAQLGEDGSYSNDDMMKINTSYMALGYDVKERVDGTYKAIQAMDKKTMEANYQWFDLVLNATSGMQSGDAQEIWDTVRPFVSGEKGLQTYEAMESITKKRSEIAAAQPTPEVFTSPTGVTEKYPEAGWKYTDKGYVPVYKEPTAPPTELDLQAETQKKLDYAYNTGNASYFNQTAKSLGIDTIFETYKQKYKPEGAGGKQDRTTSLPQLEKYREKALNADTWEDAESIIKDYTEAGYDKTQLGVNKESWASVKKSDLDNLVAVLDEITAGTPEGRNIKGKKEFSFNIDDKEVTKTGAEWYEVVYESYIALLKLLEETGVDISQYKKLKPLSEIKKIKFGGFVGKGVETGDLTFIYY